MKTLNRQSYLAAVKEQLEKRKKHFFSFFSPGSLYGGSIRLSFFTKSIGQQ